MSVIKRVGAPTRTTKGAVGDIYIDLKGRKAYMCTSAYRDSTGTADYTWREKEEAVDEEEITEAPVEQPKVVEEPVIEEVEKIEDIEVGETQKSYSTNKPPKHNYNKYHKR